MNYLRKLPSHHSLAKFHLFRPSFGSCINSLCHNVSQNDVVESNSNRLFHFVRNYNQYITQGKTHYNNSRCFDNIKKSQRRHLQTKITQLFKHFWHLGLSFPNHIWQPKFQCPRPNRCLRKRTTTASEFAGTQPSWPS